MLILTAIFIFFIGAIIGSFLSVVIYRTHHRDQKIIFSRSICPHCKKQLKWRYLIPLFSWLFLRGKCGYCGKKISPHYFALEITTGLATLALFLNYNFLSVTETFIFTIDWKILSLFFFYLIEIVFLILIFFYDLLYKEIPDRISIPAIALALVGSPLIAGLSWITVLSGGIIIALFFLLQFIVSRGTWIGGGDIRLGLLMGAFLGLQKGILALILGYFIGSIISIFLLITKQATRKTAIPFGPFLVIGTLIALFYGTEILEYYSQLSLF